MIFLVYLAIGIVLCSVRFPKWFVAWSAREWPSLGWESSDTLMCVVLTIIAILAWPIVALIVFVHKLGKITVHQRLVDMHTAAKGKS